MNSLNFDRTLGQLGLPFSSSAKCKDQFDGKVGRGAQAAPWEGLVCLSDVEGGVWTPLICTKWHRLLKQEGPPRWNFLPKPHICQRENMQCFFFKCISYKLFINYFVFCSCVLYAIWRKRDFYKYSIKVHNQTSLLTVSLTWYQAMLLWAWREESK